MTDRCAARAALAAAGALLPLLAGAPLSAAPSADELLRHVGFLTSEELEGRRTGSEGARRAAAYLAGELERLGARPLGDRIGYEVPFQFTAGASDEGSVLTLHGAAEAAWTGASSVQALAFSESEVVSGPLVFAGYGIASPGGGAGGYDSYAGLDVRDKIVMVLRYFPEDLDPEARASLARYSGLRYKAMQARERGARGLLVVTGPRSPNAGQTAGMGFDSAAAGSGIAAASISGEIAERIFELLPGRTLEQAQAALDGGAGVGGYEFPGVEVGLDVRLRRELRTALNVVGVLPGSGGASKRYLVVGSHFDHLGKGRSGNSLARADEADGIHYGADDNASGVAAVLGVAERLAVGQRRRDVVVAFWSGEELGLLGSTAFLRSGIVPAEEIAAYVNFDMVGRMRDNRLAIQAAGSSSRWPDLVEEANAAVGFDLQLQADPQLPTDSSSFYREGVPTLNFFTGSHEDYHRPADVAGRINYGDLDRVVRLGALVARRVANLEEPPDFVKVDPKVEAGGARTAARAFTGTIPDYESEASGLRLAGVIGGSPADGAGLRVGDLIVGFAGQTIANVYDYTYALDGVKLGEPVTVVFLRDGEKAETTLTPRARH